MQYTKPMIDLVLLIRKTAPTHIKSQIKLANPDLLEQLINIYPNLEGRGLRSLVVELMTLAGPDWVAELKARSRITTASARPTPAPLLQEGSAPLALSPHVKPRTKIYRGQVVPAAT